MQPRKPKSAPLPLNGCVHQDHKHAPFCFKLVSAPGKTLCPFHELLAAEKERQRSAAAKMREAERKAKPATRATTIETYPQS